VLRCGLAASQENASEKDRERAHGSAPPDSASKPTATLFDANRPSRAADEKRDEVSAGNVHSITSSAATSSVGGTVRPSDLAVFALTTSLNLVGSCTGRS
jgi:hypothetical protein